MSSLTKDDIPSFFIVVSVMVVAFGGVLVSPSAIIMGIIMFVISFFIGVTYFFLKFKEEKPAWLEK